MKVIVIGAGIIGLLTALRLQQQGADVVILEKGEVAKESSWAGAGILCPIHPWLYPDSFTNLINASLDLYPELQDELMHETGHDIQRIQSGLLIPCFDDDTIKHQDSAMAWSKRFDWQVERLNAEQAQAFEPTLSSDVGEVLLWQDVYQVRNPELLKAALLYLHKLNVPVVAHSEVSLLLEDGNGAVVGVQTSDGKQWHGDAVLLSAGSWSAGLAKQSGFELPVQPVKGQIVLLKSQPGTLKHIIKHDTAYFVPRKDGCILVGATMENVGFERGNTEEALHDLVAATRRLLPGLKDVEIACQWMGFRPGSPDGLPFLGEVQSKKGLWVATGHYRNGVALAPITAKVIADWILGIQPSLNMQDFSPNRKVKACKDVGYPKA